jgi:hypothetical protein
MLQPGLLAFNRSDDKSTGFARPRLNLSAARPENKLVDWLYKFI